MTAPDVTSLRALAEAATPGPWTSQGHGQVMPPLPWTRQPWWRSTVAECQYGDITQTRTDAAFIAAANPTAVLGLLDEIDQLQATVESLIEAAHAQNAVNDALAATVARVEALADEWTSFIGEQYAIDLRAALETP